MHNLLSAHYDNAAALYHLVPLYKTAPLAAEEKMPCVPTKLVFWMAWGQCKSLQCPTDIFTMHDASDTIVGIIWGLHYICSQTGLSASTVTRLSIIAAGDED